MSIMNLNMFKKGKGHFEMFQNKKSINLSKLIIINNNNWLIVNGALVINYFVYKICSKIIQNIISIR